MSSKKDKFENIIDNTKRYIVFVTNNTIAQKCLLSGLELVFKNIESKSAADLKSAKALIASKKPDLLFLDIELKDNEKGLSLLEGQDRSKKAYPIVLLTKSDHPDLFDNSYNLGVDEVILIPENNVINPDVFLQTIKSIVQGKHLAPLGFQGRAKGLGSANLNIGGEVISISENTLSMKADILPAIGSSFTVKINNLVIPCVVTEHHSENKGPKKAFDAKIDYAASSELNPRQIREYIFSLKNKTTK